jgi:predicted ATP-dependent serine protease
MIEIKGGKKEQIVRQWINEAHEGQVPRGKVLDAFNQFENRVGAALTDEISYGLFNGVLKKIVAEGGTIEPKAQPAQPKLDSVVPTIIKVEDMQFPDFKLHKTGKKIDELFSDHEEGGGIYGGTVNIVIGESGVGKSTVLLDFLGTIQDTNADAKILYISSEMTRNDILFYYKKTPAIGKVPTLLLMDYIANGQLSKVLEAAFNGEHDIIVLDSYQDVLVKLKEAQGWKSTQAESWLTNMMIKAAEDKGCAVLAIQHMTKGGTYVGSTYLKHATTAMLEIRFDVSGQRYLEFSKNRRGGSGVGKRLYYQLDESGSVVYDADRFKETEDIRKIENTESIRQHDLTKRFEEIFLKPRPQDSVEEAVPVEVETVEETDED